MNSPFRIFLAAAALAVCSCTTTIPLSYTCENSGEGLGSPTLLPLEELPVSRALPDPLEWSDGSGRVKNFSQWERRRNEIFAELQYYEVGVKPQTPKDCVSAEIRRWQDPEVQPEPMLMPDGRPWPNPYAAFKPDTINVTVSVGGESLTMHCPVIYPEGEGPFPAIIGVGQGAGSLPPHIFAERGIAMIGFPFWDVMEHTQVRGNQPINRLYPEYEEFGAYAAWPWGVSRVIDGLEVLGAESRIDLGHLAVSGCSFAGKMALWSGAFDERIALTIAQEPGGGGAAAWRVSETLGNVETLGRTNYAWFKESMRQFEGENVARLPFDHHELCAMVCPRALLVFGNPDYEWLADEAGYVSCAAARKVWETFGIGDRMGYSFKDKHMHCSLPEEQWPELEAFVDRFLLGKEVATDVRKAPMFEGVDLDGWINW